MGIAPISTCLQGRCITCLPRPQLASRLGAAPSKRTFGESTARLVPGLSEIWRGCRELHPDFFPLLRLSIACRSRCSNRSGKENKHLLVIYSIPARGFTAAVSVFRGTPPAKPFDFKIWFRHSSALSRDRGADRTGGEPRFSRVHFRLVPGDIIKMPLCSFSQSRCLSLLLVSSCSLHGETKNPASFR
jgi:hypothetical protein